MNNKWREIGDSLVLLGACILTLTVMEAAMIAMSLIFEEEERLGCWILIWISLAMLAGGIVVSVKKDKILRNWRFVGQYLVLVGVTGFLSNFLLLGTTLNHSSPSAKELTVFRLKMIQESASAYMLDLKQLPPTVNGEFVKAICQENSKGEYYMEFSKRELNADGEVLDAWGTPLRIVANADESLTFISAGKDKKFGTKDDLSVTTPALPTLTVR